jgi:glycosyltransferase involved in cell wall biosynthesis
MTTGTSGDSLKLSIAMTTYNGASYVGEQLDSIFAQSRLPDELIVCDDGSTDATPQILREYATRASFLMRVVFNEERLGSSKNFEKAIGLCSGHIIALSDQDDVWYPRKLQSIQEKFENDPGLGLVFTNGDLIDAGGSLLPGDMWKALRLTRRMQRMVSGPRTSDLFLGWPVVTGATLAFRSEFKDLILPIPADVPTFVHDRWIATLISAVARIDLLEDRLIAYRLHPAQQLGARGPLLDHLVTPYRTSSDQRALAAIRERLTHHPSRRATPEFLCALSARERHVANRTAFRSNRVKRFKDVAIEYASGRYNRYPMPVAYAVRDMIAGTR